MRRVRTALCLMILVTVALAALPAVPAHAATITFAVVNTTDSGSGSLRQAITDANKNPGLDTISFAIPGAGVHRIALASALPVITDPVTINGTSQPGYADVPLIELFGNGAGVAHGLRIDTGAAGSTIKGLIIGGFGGSGIVVSLADKVTIQGNFIGTNAAGTAANANRDDGIFLSGAVNNTIGGTALTARNVISGNTVRGIEIFGPGATGNVIQGNYIGTNAAGAAPIPNAIGVSIILVPANNTIGGTAAGARNVISGNTTHGIAVSGPGATGNLMQGNYIGANAAGTGPLPNGGDGISISSGSSDNAIGGSTPGAGNMIAFNKGRGVAVGDNVSDGSTGNSVRGNSIHDNGALGIDLAANGVTPNDPGDGDSGPNQLQNYPILSASILSGANVTIFGVLNSTSGKVFHVDFYASPAADSSGFGEGRTYLGAKDVTTDATGNIAFTAAFPAVSGQNVITATATAAATNDTSEFSRAVTAVQSTLSIADVSMPVGNAGTTPFAFAITLSAPSPLTVTVNYATTDGTATVADADYQATSGTLTFAPGETTKTVTVLVDGDSKVEPDETFTVALTNPGNATITKGIGTGTIRNHVAPPSPAPAPDLAVTSGHTDPFATGQEGARYTLTVTNVGTSPTIASITLTDILPDGMHLRAFTGVGWICDAAGQTVTCTNSGPLAVGAATSVVLTVTLGNMMPPQVTNTASVSTTGDTNAANDKASDVTIVLPTAPSLPVAPTAPVAPATPSSPVAPVTPSPPVASTPPTMKPSPSHGAPAPPVHVLDGSVPLPVAVVSPSPSPSQSDPACAPIPSFPDTSTARFFEQTNHSLANGFKAYWEANGGVARFGYPVCEEMQVRSIADGTPHSVQYTERARFEYHPEFAGTSYEVELGLLAKEVTAERSGEPTFRSVMPDKAPDGGRYYQETGHTLGQPFLTFWDDGGLTVYGYPISEPIEERNADTGGVYTVQYFERYRLEWHPETDSIALGRLGVEVARQRGYLPK